MTPHEALRRLVEREELLPEEMAALMNQLMAGEVSPVLTAAILVALRVKGETVGEIAAAAEVMRALATPVEVTGDRYHLLDVVGTGGDGAQTFNISTATAFVAAAGGARVAKHGNRAVSSRSGSADVLEALGARIDLPPAAVAECIAETGVGFMFAPLHHAAMRHVMPVRRELGVRTMFNVLGPLTNPARAPNSLLGVFDVRWVGMLARVMGQLGAEHVLVVHGLDGLDEVTLGAETAVAEWVDGAVREYRIHPEDFGMTMASRRHLVVENAAESATMIRAVLANKPGAARDVVVLNAGVALYAANRAPSIAEGVSLARELVASGAARERLEAFVTTTRRLAGERG
ncbi:MAG: anthranilate phosphoribosyltransferase [Hydrogenophilus sp.]|nr:anthranilate phosphoribosyltransferase [Hydrogenophilus sp.]